ncbi:unnamed protein product [Aspergillus oryzae var. brunneus]|uniref:Unnamed protein product n=2 Tax=Aspergillus oryzae TaxID=5062 RepID=A0AAN5BMA6_ASPOZ|nr:unnamed protein product [Aspergillus oryzae]GMG43084.1 unnamed protein product [Aspergillus oryzae var. brunneus]
MVLVPVREKDLGNEDVVVFEISGHTQCPLWGSLLTSVIEFLGENMKTKNIDRFQKLTGYRSTYLDYSQLYQSRSDTPRNRGTAKIAQMVGKRHTSPVSMSILELPVPTRYVLVPWSCMLPGLYPRKRTTRSDKPSSTSASTGSLLRCVSR